MDIPPLEGLMGVNRAIVSGPVGEYGVKLSYTEQAKPRLSFSLTVVENGRHGATFRTFVPCVVVGPQAEALAETLEPGDVGLLEGKLTYRAWKTKDGGKLVVTFFAVERLNAAAVAVSTDWEVSMIEVTVRDGLYIVTLPKAVLVLTKVEFIQALRRGKWWRRRQTLNVRLASQEWTWCRWRTCCEG